MFVSLVPISSGFQGNYIEYSGDPLQDFTLMRFLDRFVYRNPKVHKGKGMTPVNFLWFV